MGNVLLLVILAAAAWTILRTWTRRNQPDDRTWKLPEAPGGWTHQTQTPHQPRAAVPSTDGTAPQHHHLIRQLETMRDRRLRRTRELQEIRDARAELRQIAAAWRASGPPQANELGTEYRRLYDHVEDDIDYGEIDILVNAVNRARDHLDRKSEHHRRMLAGQDRGRYGEGPSDHAKAVAEAADRVERANNALLAAERRLADATEQIRNRARDRT